MSTTRTPHITGTYVFDTADSRRGRALNRLCGSLKDAGNRARFSADEGAYCEEYGLTAEQREAVLTRDWTRMLELGGSIFYVFKLAVLDQKSMQYLGGVFTGMTTEEFTQALRAGGRSFG
ncbi:protocatechuate 3,4-dioxygenase [Streptomyces sp. NPDC047042]|uniref:protocatechuate 3,4-dioxygenase n=1 Tax=Streptomyces sp. NPDC047042 TaxID=3154807 RepID=UPI0033F15EF5